MISACNSGLFLFSFWFSDLLTHEQVMEGWDYFLHSTEFEKLEPNSIEALTSFGILLKERGEIDKAFTYLNKAACQDPNERHYGSLESGNQA